MLAIRMRILRFLPFCVLVCLVNACSFSPEKSTSKRPPSDWFYLQRAFPYQEIDYTAYRNALKSAKESVRLRNPNEGYTDPWQIVGPTNINGRITDIEMPVDDTNTIYAGTASGGIFKSIDQGDSWRPIFDDALSLSIGDMALAPSNNDIIYVGTGEANAGGGSLAYDGVGVYRSLDAGVSWTHLGLENVGSIGRVMVHPNDHNIVYVAAMGRLFGNNNQRGVYKTINGGESWERIFFSSDKTGAIDLAVHPENPNIVFAAMWQRERRPYNRLYGGDESGIFKTTNGGNTWMELTEGLPQDPTEKGRIGIAIAPSNPDVLYSLYAKQDGSLQGVYKSENGGTSWQQKDDRAISDVPFIWWFGKMFVHPEDEDIAYATSLDMFRTTNGADSWFPIFEGAHVDHHALFVHPQNPDLVINGNDGGVYISQDGGRNYEFKNSIPNLQFYTCAIDNTNPENIFGGTQDNGTLAFNPAGQFWEQIVGGDGFRVMSDPNNPDIIFAEFQFGNLRRSNNGGATFSAANRGITGPTNWNTPYVMDPNNSNILYYGSDKVFKTTDQGDSWRQITTEIPITEETGNLTFGTITSLSVSSINDNYLFTGTDDGQVAFLDQATSTLSTINDGLPERWVTALAADPYDENIIYITLSGFRFDESGAHVYKSENLGRDWEDISTTLPDIPVNDIIVDPEQRGLLYIATDVGVYFSEDDGASWEILGTELPLVPVIDIDFHLASRKLAAATYGRSIFTYDLPLPTATDDFDGTDAIVIYPNPVIDQLMIDGLVKGASISIIDMSGKLIMDSENYGEFVDVSGLVAGVYFVRVENRLFKFVKI